MHKTKIWLLFILVSLASCQSSRFMQDDMYFTEIDAVREVREYENSKNQAKLTKEQSTNANNEGEEAVIPDENYYDYSYTSRLRRFNSDNNTWGYYDPYYTNYYWYNNSNPSYFGNSVYSTYRWWGFSHSFTSSKGWTNPWKSSHLPYKTPYNRYAFNGWNGGKLNSGNLWNTGLGFTSMYYNSFDNNCYGTYYRITHNFSALMQKNGIERNVFQRPEINYTAIRESKVVVIPVIPDTNSVGNSTSVGIDADKSRTYTVTIVQEDNSSNTNKSTTNTKNTSNTTNSTTTKRWDNHNADLNITPNTNKTENNTSRSGTYSEGSRNNNYIYSGSAIQNKGSNNKGGTQTKGKDPNR